MTARQRPGTIVIDTQNKFLYLVQAGGRAIRYGIGVGRPADPSGCRRRNYNCFMCRRRGRAICTVS